MFSAFCGKHSGLTTARFWDDQGGGPKAALFAGGRAATGLQPGYEKKSFVGSQMLVSSDSIYVKTGL